MNTYSTTPANDNPYAQSLAKYLEAQGRVDILAVAYGIKPETPFSEYPADLVDAMDLTQYWVLVTQGLNPQRWQDRLLGIAHNG